MDLADFYAISLDELACRPSVPPQGERAIGCLKKEVPFDGGTYPRDEIVNTMKFHEQLFSLRTQNGFTQAAVAAGAGLSLRAYQNYERGLREPKITAVIALADFYHISTDELLGRNF